MSVRSRVQRVAQPRPPSQIQDRAVPHVSHDRFLPVRAPLPFHPQLRGGPDPQSESERPAGIHPAQHNKPEPFVERGSGGGRGRRWKRVQRELEQQRLVARADRRLPAGDGDRCRGDHPQPHENQLVELVQLEQLGVQPAAVAKNELVELDDQPTPSPSPSPSPPSSDRFDERELGDRRHQAQAVESQPDLLAWQHRGLDFTFVQPQSVAHQLDGEFLQRRL